MDGDTISSANPEAGWRRADFAILQEEVTEAGTCHLPHPTVQDGEHELSFELYLRRPAA
jgi:hypothetical protein